VVSLRAKGVDPLTTEPALLSGWRLVFDIPDFFTIEGGTGNIQPAAGDAVHGVLHGCRSRDLSVLDQLEALGIQYSRVETTVTTYSGRAARAYVYLGLESVLDASCLPSERYRNILVRGAVAMNLDSRYVERLRSIRTCSRVERGTFDPKPGAGEVFTLERLRESPSHTALAGRVFDMSDARASHAYMRKLLGGKDATLLFLKRMDTSTGTETIDDLLTGRMTAQQNEYINGYLHEFDREYRYVGRLEYHDGDVDAPEILGGPTKPACRSAPSAHDSWTPAAGISSIPSALEVPARVVLEKAEAARAELGHENLGFLSSAYGFMPADLPRSTLPSGYEAWDQLAAELPELYRSLRLRRACEDLPLLEADADHLPDDALLRAALVLGFLSHAYQYVETSPPAKHPPALALPWAQVRARLGRGPAVLTYQDLIVYNWRLLDPYRSDPMMLDNMRLLLPTVDNKEERTFYLTQTQILAHTSPIVGAVVRAQEAVLLDDREALESALMTIIACLQRVVRESLLHINPNPDSATYVDPVVWAKTVAPFAVPMIRGVQGPSGTSSPIFNTLDVFFGRRRYETFLGREIVQLRDTYPPLWREFIAALHEISVSDYVASRGNAHLSGLLHDARSIYAGPNGFLGRHRMKVYGYLELAFKVGRSVTIGGFNGVFKDRTWDQVDAELEKGRVERVQSFPQSCYRALVKPRSTSDLSAVFDVVLDVSGTGLRYEAGDRCGVLPENDTDIIERTIKALGATGRESIVLSAEWCDAIRLRRGYEHRRELELAELLRFGQLRPVNPRVAEALHAVSQNDVIERAIHEGKSHHWELWEAIEVLRADGFDLARLLDAQPTSSSRQTAPVTEMPPETAPESPSLLCEIVPPENFRMYSISSVMSSAETESATELRLTVGRLEYDGLPGQPRRRGVASTFLAAAAGRTEPVSIVIQHPPRFGLPHDGKRPLVMIAGGSGIAPFRSFIAERQKQLAQADTWLLLGVRSRMEFVCGDELAPLVQAGQLRVDVAFSRDDVGVHWQDGAWRFVPEARRHIGDAVRDEANARHLWELLRPVADGGLGACVYVCGRTSFAKAAIDALKDVFVRFAPCPEEEREAYAARVLRELAGEGRFMQEIFSGEAAAEDLPAIDISEIALHNDDAHGYWLVIEGRVYDMSEYIRLHPGGMRVLLGYAGTDATDGYTRAHYAHTEIDAMREMYAIGVVRTLALRGASASVTGPLGTQVVSLSGAHRAWVKNLYLAVEMQNALSNDLALQTAVTTRDDPPAPRSPYKLQKAIETHQRFLRSYVDGLADESFPSLWGLTHALFAPTESAEWMTSRLDLVRSGTAPQFVEAMAPALHRALDTSVASVATEDESRARITRACEILEEEAQRFLGDVKMTLRDGVRVFEELERATLPHGADSLLAICKRLPELLLRYYAALVLRLGDGEGWEPNIEAVDAPEPSQRAPMTQRLLRHTRYWSVEEQSKEKVVVLRRTPIAFDTLEVLERENADVIATIRAEHASFGVVVDMRQAPPRNDPEFEGAMRTLRETVTQRYARLAVLLASIPGVLQVNRLGRGEGERWFATMSETAAMKFAKGET
jgi:sulfite reductase (NADPH) flavoprotein alpha-component